MGPLLLVVPEHHQRMTDIAALVDSLGGMAQKQQLVRRGARDLDLTAAVKNGSVFRARQGWYSTLAQLDDRVRAVRVGGRLTGISAIIAVGGWVLGAHPLHVSIPRNAARLRSQRNRRVRFDTTKRQNVVLHWDDAELGERGTAMVVALLDALYRVVLDESLETAVAALDWALHTRQIDDDDFEALIRRLPGEFRTLRDWVDPTCESLPESLSRTRLRLRGHSVVTQVPLGNAKRIDLVVDGCVGIETDGRKFHVERFEHDRHKDVEITIARLHGLRASAVMVFYEWESVELAIETALSTHVDAPADANSGLLHGQPVIMPGNIRLRRRRPRKSPEFPKGWAHR
jgi:hypothetical protein